MSDLPLQICPNCSQPTLKKCISAAGFRLKGGGWYETDFKGGHKKNIHGDKEKTESTPKTEAAATKETKAPKAADAKPPKATNSPSSTAAE
jgi:predicted nucleic acid-binding Zn ribbon protein